MNRLRHVEVIPADSTESVPESPNFEYKILVGCLMGADGERMVGVQTFTALFPVDFDLEGAKLILADLERAIHWVETGEYDGVDPDVLAERERYTIAKARGVDLDV